MPLFDPLRTRIRAATVGVMLSHILPPPIRGSQVQVVEIIVFRRQMFGGTFAISHGVRGYFAPGP